MAEVDLEKAARRLDLSAEHRLRSAPTRARRRYGLQQPHDIEGRLSRRPVPTPPYDGMVANRVKSSFKDHASDDAFEISDYRWVHPVGG